MAVILMFMALSVVSAQGPVVERIATNLENPRGIAVMPDGRLLVLEAGTGYYTGDAQDFSGKLSLFEDRNGDGDYEDSDEIRRVYQHLPSYNALIHYSPGRDEVIGLADIVRLADGRVFYTVDDTFQEIAIVALTSGLREVGQLYLSDGTLNAIIYDSDREVFYVAESTANRLGAVTLEGDYRSVAEFPTLASDQQAVPSGLALDPLSGDVLVALFSGQLYTYYGSLLSFMPGEAKVVRVNPVTGAQSDEIVGLTTAIDVAVDEAGNIFVLEMTTRWPPSPIAHEFDLYDPDGPPDDGGYSRFAGRVTLYPVDGSAPVRLADGLDQPTNITYHEGLLYVSVGQGTPGRPIIGPDGPTRVVGEIYRISDYQG